MPAKLRNGVVGAKGGKRRNAGDKMRWFKEELAKIARSPKSFDFLRKCIDGGEVDRVVIDGEIQSAPAPANVRLAAWSEARDTGYGRPTASWEIQGESAAVGIVLPSQSLGKKGDIK